MAATIWVLTEWKSAPTSCPRVRLFVVFVVVFTPSGEHWVRRALLFKAGDEVPEGTRLVVVSY